MDNGSLLGALAIFTVGAALLGGFGALAYFLRDPANRERAHRTLVRDQTATTDRQSASGEEAPLKTRLEHSESSSHPDDPKRASPAA